MINTQNQPSHHLALAIFSLGLFLLMWLLGINHQRAAAAVPFFLLFFVMVIGPAARVFPGLRKLAAGNFPINWRSQFGIWFTIWSIIHVLFVFAAREWQVREYIMGISPWAFGAFVAIFISIILAATSHNKALKYLGVKSWKYLQMFAHAVWWLTAVHIVDRALLRPGFPSTDPLHWVYLIMILLLPVLQTAGFVKIVYRYRREGEYPANLW